MHAGGHRDARIAIRLALALSYFNFVATGAARVVLTLYALELGAPASVVGILGGLLFLFPLLLSWPIGAAADRMGATVVEVASAHVPMLSQPDAVLDVIRATARAV